MPINYQHCLQLRNIPETKYAIYKNFVTSLCPICSKNNLVICDKCALLSKLYDRYYMANIPIDYWDKTISNFYGDKKLEKLFNDIASNIDLFFNDGKSIFFKGQHGVGKTFISSLLLKKIVEKGYNGLYTTLFDIVNVLIYGLPKDKFEAARELKMIDFLVIDEFDPRFFSENNAAELFGRILESIIRIRFQNKLPTIMITNNPDPAKQFSDSLKASIDSLLSGYCKIVFVTGPDARKNNG